MKTEKFVFPVNLLKQWQYRREFFCQLAANHDTFVKNETAARLNLKGSAKTFQVGDKVKVRVPPTAIQLEETGRRAKHVAAWRGPCTIVERLSATTYSAVDDTSRRMYERSITNLLSYRAKRAKVNAEAAYSPTYSEPFAEDELIAVRDEPAGPIYLARIMAVDPTEIALHYYGCTEITLANATFKPCGHTQLTNDIILSVDVPESYGARPRDNPDPHVEYSGRLQLKDLHTVLVARKLELTKAHKLRFRSIRALAPVNDQIFRFER